MCKNSDRVVLLAEKFIKELEAFTLSCKFKVLWMPNPVTVEADDRIQTKKENILLYVGRLDTTQKKVDYLLKIWLMLYKQYPDGRLARVGDGEEKEKILSVKFVGKLTAA